MMPVYLLNSLARCLAIVVLCENLIFLSISSTGIVPCGIARKKVEQMCMNCKCMAVSLRAKHKTQQTMVATLNLNKQ